MHFLIVPKCVAASGEQLDRMSPNFQAPGSETLKNMIVIVPKVKKYSLRSMHMCDKD
jgi:hypothetical protein